MANLRDRLKRIQIQKKVESASPRPATKQSSIDISFFEKQGWSSCGYMALEREFTSPVQAKLPEKLPPSIMILIPDLERICGNGGPQSRALTQIEDFLFFDLETSGLSGGAGTVAFLAAFGRFVKKNGGISLHITQYLLLDYPGENDFLSALLGEFNNKEQIIVSYNGKSFDTQILKTRCLMNRIQPPEYFHADCMRRVRKYPETNTLPKQPTLGLVDLLHPARRLWKTVLENCSQATIETGILGLDREGDIPGALAPEIWFDFLKTGNTTPLMGICDHNCRDIAGLAAILCAMSDIAADPFGTIKKYHYDIEQLALRWRSFVRWTNVTNDNIRLTANELLRLAVKQKCPRASLVYALDKLRSDNCNEGRKLLLRIAASSPTGAGNFPDNICVAALRALAIDSERRLKSITEALEFTRQGLELQLTESSRKEFQRRCERLEGKLAISY